MNRMGVAITVTDLVSLSPRSIAANYACSPEDAHLPLMPQLLPSFGSSSTPVIKRPK